ncbi:MAG: 2-succinyl-5-enolpyruvyl-6-hydroxy-3-cyclohexene-1-carboxylate synthase, partial [Flavobacteriaceae bacterium]|nr:2-succinyl-5-enolpyruvyl-6-hydroxy-3-cyclohexene-1-carboxylate synthase [Flavobacteriaceae bacterium]
LKLLKAHRARMHQKYLESIPYCDLKVFEKLLETLPDNTVLQMGNSSAIRYTQLFDLKTSVEVFCNRGTSGIDGSMSTAAGSAVVSNKQTVHITGDLSFFYDSNALWNNYIPSSFRIILINNGGGGIFRILPGHKNTENFDTYFETIHDLNARPLCEMYNLEYSSAQSVDELNENLAGFYDDSERPKLIEIFTPRLDNDSILLNYFEYIK